MKKLTLLSLAVILSAALIGCKEKNPQLYSDQVKLDPVKVDKPDDVIVNVPPPPVRKDAEIYTQTVDLLKQSASKIDVLFLMDTSDSMYCDQDKLTKNIKLFSDEFAKKKSMLDFHIGAVGAWDSETFGNKPKNCELGELRPVRSKASDNKDCSVNTVQNYVTRDTPNLEKTLGLTLAVGVEALAKKTDAELFKSGPENEELFRPIIAALSAENMAMNFNFRRPDAHLAVVIFTDTDNYKTDTSTSELIRFLRSSVTGDATVSTYAVMARYNDVMSGKPLGEYPRADMKNCRINPVDPYIRTTNDGQPGGPITMVEFLKESKHLGMGGVGFDLKDANYGANLAELGKGIVKKTLRKVIPLDFPINIAQKIVVKYGTAAKSVEIKMGDNGWAYDAGQAGINDDKLIISETAELPEIENGKIMITYTPVR